MCEKLKKQTVEERKKVIGLASKRADIIVCGILIYKELMERDGYETMIVSDGDN
ncbi:MAG TPA: phosphatase, partial [Eubacteriaceae bacterium]|nr:phosphatase [Eubacteriaceae bacterium]